MTRAELKSLAKAQINGKIGVIFIISLIIFAITLICNLIPIAGNIVAFIIAPAFSLSFCIIYLKLTKEEKISISDSFSGFNQMGRAVWLYIIMQVFTFLWSLLLVIPGIIKSYSYSMAFYVLADNPELTAREALNRSKEIMNGHKMELFVLQLSFIWWSLLTICTFGIAGIYVLPYIEATVANFYNSIKE